MTNKTTLLTAVKRAVNIYLQGLEAHRLAVAGELRAVAPELKARGYR